MRSLSIFVTALLVAPAFAAGTQPPADELRASDAAQQDTFGHSLAAADGTTVVGTAYADGAAMNSGAVYVFTRSLGPWTQQAKLVQADADLNDLFGSSVDVELDTLAVGATSDDEGAPNAGAVYVFVRSGTTWSQEAKLLAIDADSSDHLGSAISLSGDTVVAGAPHDWNLGGGYTGSAHVFVREGTEWTQQAKIRGLETGDLSLYGSSVSLEGDLLAVGAPGNASSTDSAVYVHVRVGTRWAQVARLVPSDGRPAFGVETSLCGDRLAVSAGGGVGGTGAIYVFERQGQSWVEVAQITASGTNSRSAFGLALDLEGDTILAGGSGHAADGYRVGSAWVFHRDDVGGWSERARLVLDPPQEEAGLGWSVAIDGSSLFAGAQGDSLVAPNGGAVFVYDMPDAFDSFCDADDGALASCPCGPGAPDTGCELAQGTGGVGLEVLARETSPLQRATLQGTGFPAMGAPAAVVVRAATREATPVVFGDGLRCVGTPLVRLGAGVAVGGQSTHTIGHGAMAGTGAFHYQLWFRNTPVSFCDPAAAFNLSNGRTIDW